ncbi:MAG TPA: amylo-alpha-1,6-glucosidase [Pyrinomonadaceae bacterium]|nr:amylo-alpha-1,6-glucosidase [Pyrinomonadaceae bacterium]
MIKLDKDICVNYAAASSREWLETNGIGGFACGTVAGSNTRRYHALLTSAIDPPLGRIRLLSKFEETIIMNGRRFDLSANQFPSVISPKGYEYLTAFRLDPFPIWTYEIEGNAIEKNLFMINGSNATVCLWRFVGKPVPGTELIIRPLLSFVDYHSLQSESSVISFDFASTDDRIEIGAGESLPTLCLTHNGNEVIETGYWYRNFEYMVEQERGFDFSEDLYQPFEIVFELDVNEASIYASTEPDLRLDLQKAESNEIKRRSSLIRKAGYKSAFGKQLSAAADQFIVKRGEGRTVIAGYPWFSDWGRDTMISLTGLSLAVGRADVAKEILQEFSDHVSEGMLPNRFPDAGGDAEYNTVDATLWYFEAIRAFIEQTGDAKAIRESIYPKLADIVAWHLHGTRYNIHLDTDGLLFAGTPDVQLTWMDAKIGEKVITPRTGKPVEIQALWYNALMIMEGLAKEFGDKKDASRYRAMADLCKLSFNGAFWNEEEGCLFDVIENGERDPSVRPNQILAVSLFHSMLDAERAAKVVAKVESELLTPVGLRSLSPRDAKYCGVYTGTPFERDSAYHQGTVWAWLIGPFIDAYRKVNGAEPDLDKRVSKLLNRFEGHLSEAGLGQMSEIFDGDHPHTPRGCFAQAWSVAEVLRVLGKKP